MSDPSASVESRRFASEIKIALGLGALAFLLRLIYLFQMSGGPYFTTPQLDELFYDFHARRLAGGRGLGEAPLFRAPLYHALLGLCYRVFGHDYFLPRFFQAGAGAATSVLTWMLGRRVFNPMTALIGGLLVCFWPVLIFFDGELLTVSLEILLQSAALWALVKWSQGEPRRTGWLAAAGLLFGLTAIARPNVLLTAPWLFGWTLWRLRRRGAEPGAIVARLALFTLAVIAPIAPVTAYNWVKGDEAVLIASQGGINFWLGNKPGATGYSVATPVRFDYTEEYRDSVALYGLRQAEIDMGRELSEAGASRYWTRRTWASVAERPVAWAGRLARKALLFWFADEIKNNKEPAFAAQWSGLLKALLMVLPFGLIGPFALARIVRRRPAADEALLIGYLFFYMTSVVLFFVCARYRAPLIPIVALFAADGWARLASDARARRWGALVLTMALAGVFAAATWPDWFGARRWMDETRSHEAWVAGNGFTFSGRYADAIVQYRLALRAEPDNIEYWLNLGRAQLLNGGDADADTSYNRVLALKPDHAGALSNLALLAHRRGDEASARDLWGRALALNPNLVAARLGLGNLMIESGEYMNAITWLEGARKLAPDSPDTLVSLGRCYRAEASENLLQVVREDLMRLGAWEALETLDAWTPPERPREKPVQ